MAELDFATQLTMSEVFKRMDASGKMLNIAEVLERENAMIRDIPWMEANEKISHKSSVRNSQPAGKSRVYNQGVAPSASSTTVNQDVIEMLEDFSTVDEHLAAHSGDIAAVRSKEDIAFISGMGITMASRLLYGNNSLNPEQMTGLAPRMASTRSTVVDNGGSGSDVTSLYIVQWGPSKVYGIYPKGTPAGITMIDKNLQRKEDSNGKVMYAYETQFILQFGLVVEDERCIARVANIETSGTTNTFDFEKVIEAQYQMYRGGAGAIAYANRTLFAQIVIAALNKVNNNLTMQNVFGNGEIPVLNGIPIRMGESIVNTETAIS